MPPHHNRILIVGGTTLLGRAIATALIAENASVKLLIQPHTEPDLGMLQHEVEWSVADVWNPASLRGQARHCSVVIHTIGGLKADPSKGLTHHYLNYISARNVATMCITDGAKSLLYMSVARMWWLAGSYQQAKHEAESYLKSLGIELIVVRAPLVYQRHAPRPLPLRVYGGAVGWLPLANRYASIPLDVMGRAVARIALQTHGRKRIYWSRDLWRLNTPNERRGQVDLFNTLAALEPPIQVEDTKPTLSKISNPPKR
ncbi:MAG: SDR family oxidoreductase [Phototrophicaceae bacterium]